MKTTKILLILLLAANLLSKAHAAEGQTSLGLAFRGSSSWVANGQAVWIKFPNGWGTGVDWFSDIHQINAFYQADWASLRIALGLVTGNLDNVGDHRRVVGRLFRLSLPLGTWDLVVNQTVILGYETPVSVGAAYNF